MKSYPLIASSLFLEPWLIMPGTHASLSEQFRKAVTTGDFQAAGDGVGPAYTDKNGTKHYDHPQVEISNGIALVKIEGIIGRKLGWLEMMCGGYDIALLEQQMRNIAEDDTIRAVVIDIDSPGGRAQGVEQAALSIRECAAAGKKIYGWTEGVCASAGYFLAAACDELYAHQDAIVGSISTICAGVDDSRAWEMEGLELKLVATGSLKAMGHPGKRWTEEEMTFMRERAQVVDDVFKNFVRSCRVLDDSAMNGGHWYARKSPDKIIDGCMKSIDDVIAHAWSFDM